MTPVSGEKRRLQLTGVRPTMKFPITLRNSVSYPWYHYWKNVRNRFLIQQGLCSKISVQVGRPTATPTRAFGLAGRAGHGGSTQPATGTEAPWPGRTGRPTRWAGSGSVAGPWGGEGAKCRPTKWEIHRPNFFFINFFALWTFAKGSKLRMDVLSILLLLLYGPIRAVAPPPPPGIFFSLRPCL